MSVAVRYYSRSGNTRAIAIAMADVIGDLNKQIENEK